VTPGWDALGPQIGQVILEERTRRDLTQEDLGGMAGVARETIVAVEKGTELRLSTLGKIAAALGVTPSILIAQAERKTGDAHDDRLI